MAPIENFGYAEEKIGKEFKSSAPLKQSMLSALSFIHQKQGPDLANLVREKGHKLHHDPSLVSFPIDSRGKGIGNPNSPGGARMILKN